MSEPKQLHSKKGNPVYALVGGKWLPIFGLKTSSQGVFVRLAAGNWRKAELVTLDFAEILTLSQKKAKGRNA